MPIKFDTDNLIVEYPIQTGCHGTVTVARRIWKVVVRPLPNVKVKICDSKIGRKYHNAILVDFYVPQHVVEDAVKKYMLEKHHVQPENLSLKWEKGDLWK